MKAFTLTEVLIVLAIMLIVGAASLPLIGNWSFNAQTDGARLQLAQDVRLTRAKTLAAVKGDVYGIKLLTDGYVLFKGASYGARQTDYDVKVNLAKGLALSWQLGGSGQADEIVFVDYTAWPTRWGKIIINAGDTNSTLTLNQAGYIE